MIQQVIKEVERIVEVPVEVVKIVTHEVYVDRPVIQKELVEVIKEVQVPVYKEVIKPTI